MYLSNSVAKGLLFLEMGSAIQLWEAFQMWSVDTNHNSCVLGAKLVMILIEVFWTQDSALVYLYSLYLLLLK